MSPRRSIVLYYHRVAQPDRDPSKLCVSARNFARHVEIIAELAAVSTLQGLVGSRRHRESQATVAVTFDDGYADNETVAAPLLEAAAIPSTVFVTTDVLTSGHELWWDQLDHLILDSAPRVEELRVTLEGRPLVVDIRSDAGRQRALHAIRTRLFHRPAESVTAGLAAVASALARDLPAACSDHAMLTETQLKALSERPFVQIGSHAVSHTMLSALSPQQQATELQESKRRLEQLIGDPVTAFAYPYGERRSYGRETPALLRSAGYSVAVTTDDGPVGWWTGATRVPRYRVEDWGADDFATALRTWLGLG
jgi:peptidoglycan/xylan/chitin deacetylase (PgdA/CDA1 family)